jgi:hypothetical protein
MTTSSTRTAKIIFDNAGGTTLILASGEFAHHYSDASQAAQDYCIYMRDGNVDEWEGNEPELAKFNPSYDEIRNGGYRVFDPSDVEEAIHSDDDPSSNVREFVAAVESTTWK